MDDSFFIHFYQKNRLDISGKLAPLEKICMKCQILFSEIKKKKKTKTKKNKQKTKKKKNKKNKNSFAEIFTQHIKRYILRYSVTRRIDVGIS